MSKPAAFPPPPWRLRATAVLSGWLVPPEECPFAAPPGWCPMMIGRRAVLGAVWARYHAGGTLAYDEVAAGLVVRRGLRLGVTVGWICVDDQAALDGGRAIWAVPKTVAIFEGLTEERLHASAQTLNGETGVEARSGGLLGPLAAPFLLVQPRGMGSLTARAWASGWFALASAVWRLPFGFATRPPVLSLVLRQGRLELKAPGPA